MDFKRLPFIGSRHGDKSRQDECMSLKESSPSSTGEREDSPATGLLSSKQLPESLEVIRGNSG